MSTISKINECDDRLSSEFDSGDDTATYNHSRNSFASPILRYHHSVILKPTTVQDFRQSLENEKSIRKLMSRLDSLDVSQGVGNERIDGVLEKNYKLQIQTLLEEVNKLKLEKKLVEKRYEKYERESPGRLSRNSDTSIMGELNWKQVFDSKDATIKELEFQISHLKNENAMQKTRMEGQIKQIDELFQRLADYESLKEVLEERNEEIALLKESLETKEAKYLEVAQELSYMKNENISMKLKSQNLSFTQAPTGANSIAPSPWFSKDQSFISTMGDKVGLVKAHSDATRFGLGINVLEMNEDQRVSSPSHISEMPRRTLSMTPVPVSENVHQKSEFSRLQKMSVGVLNEYEKGLKKKAKMPLNRILEVNKIKNYYLESQNEKLLSLVNKGKRREDD